MRIALVLTSFLMGILVASLTFFSPIGILSGIVISVLGGIYAKRVGGEQKERFALAWSDPNRRGLKDREKDQEGQVVEEVGSSMSDQNAVLGQERAHVESTWRRLVGGSLPLIRVSVGGGVNALAQAGEYLLPNARLAAQLAMRISRSLLRGPQGLVVEIQQGLRFAWRLCKVLIAGGLGRKRIIWLATKGVPVVSLLPYQEPVNHWNTLLRAVIDEDVEMVKTLLQILDQQMLQQYLVDKRGSRYNALQEATVRCVSYRDSRENSAEILTLLLKAIAPKERITLLNGIEYGFFLAFEGTKAVQFVMELLSEAERQALLDYRHPLWGDTLLMAACQKECVVAVLQYYPKEKLWEYLTYKNFFGRTAFMEFVISARSASHFSEWIESLIMFLPEAQRAAFFACHDQGKKAMWFAQAGGKSDIADVLEEYGISRVVPKPTVAEKEAMVAKWETMSLTDKEAFLQAMPESFGSCSDTKESFLKQLKGEEGGRWQKLEDGFLALKEEVREVRGVSEQWVLEELQSIDVELKRIESSKRAEVMNTLLRNLEHSEENAREAILSALENYEIPIPKGQIRLGEQQEIVRRWAVTERLEYYGECVVEETPSIEVLWDRLEIIKENPTRPEAIERVQEEVRKAIEGFRLRVGRHPAEVLHVEEGKGDNPKARQKGYHTTMLGCHPDRNPKDVRMQEEARLVTAAYELYKQSRRRMEYLEGIDLIKAQVDGEIKEQVETQSVRESGAKERFFRLFSILV